MACTNSRPSTSASPSAPTTAPLPPAPPTAFFHPPTPTASVPPSPPTAALPPSPPTAFLPPPSPSASVPPSLPTAFLPPPTPTASVPPSLLRVTRSPLKVFEAPDCGSLATQAWEGRLLLAYPPATGPCTSTNTSTNTNASKNASASASTNTSTSTSTRTGPSGQQAQDSGTGGRTEGTPLGPQSQGNREGFLGGSGTDGCAGGAGGGGGGPGTQASPLYTGGSRGAPRLTRSDVAAGSGEGPSGAGLEQGQGQGQGQREGEGQSEEQERTEGQGQREGQGGAEWPQWLRDSVARGAPIPVLLLEDSYPGWVAAPDALAALEPATWPAPGAPVPGQAPGAPGPSQLAACREAATRFALEAGTRPNKYLWGGTVGPHFDCSGLVQRAYAATGVWIPRDSYQQEAFAQAVQPKDVRRGDLVFFGPPQRTTHVGIVTLVSGSFIEAPQQKESSARVETETDASATGQPLATSQGKGDGEVEKEAPASSQEPTPLASEREGEAGRPSDTASVPSTVLSEYRSGVRTVLDFPLVRVVHSSGVQSGHGGIAEDWLCPEAHEGGSAVGGRCYGIFRCFRRVTSPLAPFL